MVSALKTTKHWPSVILQLASCACAGINCMLPKDIHMTHLHTPLDSCIDSCLSIVTQLRNCHLSIYLTVDFFSIWKKSNFNSLFPCESRAPCGCSKPGQPSDQIKKPTLYTTFFRFRLCCYCPLPVVVYAIKYKTWQIEIEPQRRGDSMVRETKTEKGNDERDRARETESGCGITIF